MDAKYLAVKWAELPGKHSRLAAMHVWSDEAKKTLDMAARLEVCHRFATGQVALWINVDAFHVERAHLRKGGV